jgi:hypothetical protein
VTLPFGGKPLPVMLNKRTCVRTHVSCMAGIRQGSIVSKLASKIGMLDDDNICAAAYGDLCECMRRCAGGTDGWVGRGGKIEEHVADHVPVC